MNIEIKNRWSGQIIICGEYESIKDCLEKNKTANLSGANLSGADLYGANLSRANLSRANLSGADLYGANLSGADLYGADLSRANLSGANLSGANLYGANLSRANLSRANLSGANLSRANLSKRFIAIGWIGSRRSYTTYNFDDDFIHCGCWTGALKEFEKRVKEVHKDNKQYLAEYLGAIKYIKSLIKRR